MEEKIIINYTLENKKRIKLFGNKFIKTNKDVCKIIIDDKESEILENYEVGPNENSLLEVQLIGINNIKDMSEMFYNCRSLLGLNTFNWDSCNVTNMSNMFYNCDSLRFLPNDLNISNVTDISGLFCNCSQLRSIPDISKWNTSNVTNMSNLFKNCQCLFNLPDISKWNTSKVTDMNSMFYNCEKLKTLPDISNWITFNVKDMKFMFELSIFIFITRYIKMEYF